MPAMTLFDSHCHLDATAFDDDRTEVLIAARAAGVAEMLVPGTHRQQWPRLKTLCASDDRLYPALGLHPMLLQEHQHADLDHLHRELLSARPCALGEIGLDFRTDSPDHDEQLPYFEAQLELARQHGLPVVIHSVKANEVVLRSLQRVGVNGGTCHAFNGSIEQAERFIAMGFKLGVGGMLTFERSRRLRAVFSRLPLDAIVLETDAPDLPGQAHQYQRNSPAYLPEVLATLAELRPESADTIATTTTVTARKLFLGT